MLKIRRCPRCGQIVPHWQPIHLTCLFARSKKWLVIGSFIVIILIAVLYIHNKGSLKFNQLSVFNTRPTISEQAEGMDDTNAIAFAETPGSVNVITAAPLTPISTPTPTLQVGVQVVSTASSTPSPIPQLPTSTKIPLPTHTNTPQPAFEINPIDGAKLVYIPEREFWMGLDNTDPHWRGAESPMHPITLSAYWIYLTEVTNVMYRLCDDANACPRPEQSYLRDILDYYTNPIYDEYPVVYVTYADALAYCQWAGGYLPTEAQWEKAARGTDKRLYPWGNEGVDGTRANYCDSNCPIDNNRQSGNDNYPFTAPVGSYPAGASPYGLMDMAGNVLEWIADWHQINYYTISPDVDPIGPSSGDGGRRGYRGGSWYNQFPELQASARNSMGPSQSRETIGFRCVISNP
jgi:formylglycine-generating enzyme required for sulfatase activity